jgi:hypothetical protein
MENTPLPSFGKPRLLDSGTPPEQHVWEANGCHKRQETKNTSMVRMVYDLL